MNAKEKYESAKNKLVHAAVNYIGAPSGLAELHLAKIVASYLRAREEWTLAVIRTSSKVSP